MPVPSSPTFPLKFTEMTAQQHRSVSASSSGNIGNREIGNSPSFHQRETIESSSSENEAANHQTPSDSDNETVSGYSVSRLSDSMTIEVDDTNITSGER